MEIIQGKTTRRMGADELSARLAGIEEVLVDLGTGDGRYVLQMARREEAGSYSTARRSLNPQLKAAGPALNESCQPVRFGARFDCQESPELLVPVTGSRIFAIGVDACRENLRKTTRRLPPNALFVIANACSLPPELTGLAGRVTINFPWGSLLEGLLNGDPALMDGLLAISRLGASLEVRLNASALAEQGWLIEPAGERVSETLRQAGILGLTFIREDACGLGALPTTWARKLASGRNPSAVLIRGRLG